MTRDWRNGPPSQMRLFPLSAGFSEGGKIGRPFCGLIAAEFVEIIPAVEPGVVTVVENDPRRIISHRFHRNDLHMTLAGDSLLLRCRMALHLGARGFDAQIFGR